MNRAELMKKLQGVQALAERGAPGEQEAAAALLERLMDKYGLTESDLEAERVKTEWFRFKGHYEERLLGQIIYMIMGKCTTYVHGRSGRKRKETGVDCTPAQRLEIEMTFEFFKAAFEREAEMFYKAFVNKNRLFPPPVMERDERPDDALSEEEILKMSMFMQGIERQTMRKMIGGTTE